MPDTHQAFYKAPYLEYHILLHKNKIIKNNVLNNGEISSKVGT